MIRALEWAGTLLGVAVMVCLAVAVAWATFATLTDRTRARRKP